MVLKLDSDLEDTLRTYEEKQAFSRENTEFATIIDLNIRYTCAPISEVPSNISTMVDILCTFKWLVFTRVVGPVRFYPDPTFEKKIRIWILQRQIRLERLILSWFTRRMSLSMKCTLKIMVSLI